MRIGLAGYPGAPNLERALLRIHEEGGREVVFARELGAAIPQGARVIPGQRMAREVDVVLALGGDGTFLRVAAMVEGLPMAGVNLGRLGFLTLYTEEEIPALIRDIISGNFTVQERAILEAEHRGRVDRALNDVVVSATLARMLEVEAWVEEEMVFRFRGDGLVVSSPTGSTAYNLAAGGPIVHPELSVMILTPICAHGLTLRPVVMPCDRPIRVKVRTRGEKALLSADGRSSFTLDPEDSFTVRVSDRVARMVMVPWAPGFFRILKRKFGWG